jgi:hypothetical protein
MNESNYSHKLDKNLIKGINPALAQPRKTLKLIDEIEGV